MEHIKHILASLQSIADTPRAPVLWVLILCICTLTLLAELIGASYVYTNVRLGMEGQKTQQEKMLDEEVLLMYDPATYKDAQVYVENKRSSFYIELEKIQPPATVPADTKDKPTSNRPIEIPPLPEGDKPELR